MTLIRPLGAAVALAAALIAAPALSRAADPTPIPTPAATSAAERTLVTKMQADLPARFGTTAAAAKAGYYRFNNEDATGAISWVNGVFTSPDVDHPSQLWYDINGRLIGADYSIKQNDDPNPKTVLGIDASRCDRIGHHIHYGLKQPDGSVKYGLGASAAKFKEAGGDPDHPDAATLVKMGRATSVDEVAFVFSYDAITDCSVWIVPNANGQFAAKNPAVIPTADRVKNSSEGH